MSAKPFGFTPRSPFRMKDNVWVMVYARCTRGTVSCLIQAYLGKVSHVCVSENCNNALLFVACATHAWEECRNYLSQRNQARGHWFKQIVKHVKMSLWIFHRQSYEALRTFGPNCCPCVTSIARITLESLALNTMKMGIADKIFASCTQFQQPDDFFFHTHRMHNF